MRFEFTVGLAVVQPLGFRSWVRFSCLIVGGFSLRPVGGWILLVSNRGWILLVTSRWVGLLVSAECAVRVEGVVLARV